MQAEHMEMDRAEAHRLYLEYRAHQQFSTQVDREIQRTYRLIAQGRVVIRALDSIRAAGLGADKLPKLAIVRADATECWLATRPDGFIRFSTMERVRENRTSSYVDLPEGSLPGVGSYYRNHQRVRAIVPAIPLPLRPKAALDNYHILFEAEWERVVPKDPMLLRRLSKGDLWLVVAAWDLTAVEQAVLQARVSA